MSRESRLRRRICFVLLLPAVAIAEPQDRKNDCQNTPQVISNPQFTKEEAGQIKTRVLEGRLSIVISDAGDVVDARVIAAKPKEAAEILASAIKRMKFKPRPGCKPVKIDFVFKDKITPDKNH
jgi:hypothetical protein